MKRKLVLFTTLLFVLIMTLPQTAFANTSADTNNEDMYSGYKIDGKIYDALISIGFRIPTKIEAIRVPGTCLILEQKWCDQVQIWRGDGESVTAMFSLPVGTPVFAPINGYVSNNSNEFFSHQRNADFGYLPRQYRIIFNNQVGAGGSSLAKSTDKFFFFAYGIGMFWNLNSDDLVFVKVEKGEVLFKITESTALFEENGNSITLSVFRLSFVHIGNTWTWKDTTLKTLFN